RLASAIRRMRRGKSAAPPLPSVLPEEERRARAQQLICRRAAEGVPRAAIADELNELGITPPHAVKFTASLVTAWLDPRLVRRRGAVDSRQTVSIARGGAR